MRIVQPGQTTPYKPPVVNPIVSPAFSKVTSSVGARNTPMTPRTVASSVPISGVRQAPSTAPRTVASSVPISGVRAASGPKPVAQLPTASYYGGVTPNPNAQSWSQWGVPSTPKPPERAWGEWGNGSVATQYSSSPVTPSATPTPQPAPTTPTAPTVAGALGTTPTTLSGSDAATSYAEATPTVPGATVPGATVPTGETAPQVPIEELKYVIRTLAQKQANGINLTPEEYQSYVDAIMTSSGLSEPLELIDPSTNQTVQAYLDVGELQRDSNGMQRGVRVNLISKVLSQGINSPEELTSIIYQQMGENGLTVDEVKMMYPTPMAEDRNMGYNWENDAVIAPDGTQGNVTVTPFGTSQAPIFSGFYLAQNGLYYPVNTASLAPQGYYGESSDSDSGSRTSLTQSPTAPSVVAGANTPNANGSGLGVLQQNLY